jgi:hypothetical protein
MFLIFQVLYSALDIYQLLLRLLNSPLGLAQSWLIGSGHRSQRIVDRLGAGEHEMRTPVALFQALQTALREIVLSLQIAEHGISLQSRFA